MKHRLPFPIAVPFAAMAIAACVPQGDFPSLEPRPAERDRSMEPPVREALEVPTDPSLRQRVAELEGIAARGDQSFDDAFGAAEAAVRSAGPAESDSWVGAQQALSRLEAARTETMRALTELDRLAIDRAGMATSLEDIAAIDAAIGMAQRLAESQQQRIQALRARLSG